MYSSYSTKKYDNEILQKETKLQEVIAILISYCTVFNFMYVENLYFVEAAVMGFSVLFYILAVKQIVDKKKLYALKAGY